MTDIQLTIDRIESAIATRPGLLAKLEMFQRQHVADIVVAKIEDDLREREYAEYDMLNAPNRWDADFDCLCA